MTASEWNLTISDHNFVNDTCFQGAYIVRNYIKLLGKVDGMAYFCGTDRTLEYYDTDGELFGGGGLLTKDGVMKPAAFAFEFLNRIYPYYIGKGENYLATADGHGAFSILCHNCKNLNYNYFYVKENELDGEHFRRMCEPQISIQNGTAENGEMNLELTMMENEIALVHIVRREI